MATLGGQADDTQYWEPELPAGADELLSDEQKHRWVHTGFLAIDGLFPSAMIARAAAEAEAYFPLPGEETHPTKTYKGGGADLEQAQMVTPHSHASTAQARTACE